MSDTSEVSVSLTIAEIEALVTFKRIKHVHLSVHPPVGVVSVTAPEQMNLEVVRAFLINKLSWIRSERKRFLEQERGSRPLYLNAESHYVWGQRLLLEVVERDEAPKVTQTLTKLLLQVRPNSPLKKRREVLEAWYRKQLRERALPLIEVWELRLGVKVSHLYIQRMKTRWGSCQHEKKNIRLNSELAKKPSNCLEYIIVHEMMHLLEPSHNARFVSLMDTHLPAWRARKADLNAMMLSYEEWGYEEMDLKG